MRDRNSYATRPTVTVVTLDNYFVSMSYRRSKKPARIPPIPDGLGVSKFPPVGSASYCHQEHPAIMPLN